jgi:cell fate regulator YaaT (PSP1 superfamily)
MSVLQLQTTPWDKVYSVKVDNIDDYKVYDKVIIKTEACNELASVIDIVDNVNELDEDVSIIQKADQDDIDSQPSQAEKRSSLQYCYRVIKRLGLEMKLVDARFSFDNSRITFAFVANGRIDFRELVKDLSAHFSKNIRLQQIGIRDESKLVGDTGRCGRELCCRKHLTKFSSITGDMAEVQQLANRGSDRLSGACGRLMCCLAYEAEGYKNKKEKMPPIGAKVNVDGRRGKVINQHILKEAVDVKFPGEKGENDYIAEIDLNRHKKED